MGFDLRFRVVDVLSQTHHVECVALLVLAGCGGSDLRG
jgi:hypothetical protein